MKYLLIAVPALILTIGCSSQPAQPTVADMMRSNVSDLQSQIDLKNQLAGEWETGSKQIVTGQQRVSEGEKIVKAAEQEMQRGQRLIDDGNKEASAGKSLVESAEQRFREAFPGTELNPAR